MAWRCPNSNLGSEVSEGSGLVGTVLPLWSFCSLRVVSIRTVLQPAGPKAPSLPIGQNPESKLPRGASLVTQRVKNLPATWENQVPSLGGEDPLEKGVTTHSSIPA